MKFLKYKGYTGSIEYSREDGILYGKVLGIRGLISYEGESGPKEDFQCAIEDYLEHCRQAQEPERPFKGSFNVRVSPELHRELALAAMSQDTSLNNLVESILSKGIDQVKDETLMAK